jgi:hypothetical protein
MGLFCCIYPEEERTDSPDLTGRSRRRDPGVPDRSPGPRPIARHRRLLPREAGHRSPLLQRLGITRVADVRPTAVRPPLVDLAKTYNPGGIPVIDRSLWAFLNCSGEAETEPRGWSSPLAKVPAPSVHAFHRALAISALRAGCDLFTLQRLLGQSSLAVISPYLRQLEDDLREAHERMRPVDNLLCSAYAMLPAEVHPLLLLRVCRKKAAPKRNATELDAFLPFDRFSDVMHTSPVTGGGHCALRMPVENRFLTVDPLPRVLVPRTWGHVGPHAAKLWTRCLSPQLLRQTCGSERSGHESHKNKRKRING